VTIRFHGSPAPTLGVELELGLVDAATGELVGAAGDVLERLSGGPFEAKVKHELFQCTVEVITDVCDTVADARADLESSLDALRRITDAQGLGVIGSGTHPFSDWRTLEVSPGERYAHLIDTIQWPARRLAIHGVHFHVGVPGGAESIAVVQSLAFHLPLFLAASASSPFWLGTDTGMASSRTKVFEALPSTGLPPRLADWQEFEGFMAALIKAGSIASIREVWWDIRPHPTFGTIELRMCDAMPTMTEICALAALAQSLVAWLLDRLANGESLPGAPEWVVRENKWLASRHGLDSAFIVDGAGHRSPAATLLDELVDELTPTAAALGCADELASVRSLVERGPSYRRQRRVLDDGGDLSDLVAALVHEHRHGPT
jgi:carboxylate-amine ligase